MANLEKSALLFSFQLAALFQTCFNHRLSMNQVQICLKTLLYKQIFKIHCHLLDLNLLNHKPLFQASFKRSGKFKTEQRRWLFQNQSTNFRKNQQESHCFFGAFSGIFHLFLNDINLQECPFNQLKFIKVYNFMC